MPIFTTSDGVKLFYQVKGEGSPIVLIHGWSGDHTTFEHQVEELSKKYKVVCYDLRGHGNSERSEQGLSLNRFAADLKELVGSLELRDVTLAGHSMGAAVIFEFIKTYGVSGIKSIAILDMTPKLINDEEWKLGLYDGTYSLEDSLKDITAMNENIIEFAVPFFKTAAPYLTDEMMLEQKEMFLDNSPRVLAAMWHAMTVNDYRQILPEITVPTVVAYGEAKSLYSKETAEYLQSKIPDSRIVPFENCTHLFILENPAKTTQVIDEIASVK